MIFPFSEGRRRNFENQALTRHPCSHWIITGDATTKQSTYLSWLLDSIKGGVLSNWNTTITTRVAVISHPQGIVQILSLYRE